jgi:type IV/VI secretion system ImpK/VasF family protein
MSAYDEKTEGAGGAGAGDMFSKKERDQAPSQTLAQACAPLFLYLTSFRRNSAVCAMMVTDVRDTLNGILETVRLGCEDNPHLAKLLPKVWYALIVTADQVLLSSRWSEKLAWSQDLQEMAVFSTAEGGHRFYELVEEALSRPGAESAEIAEVMFTCMALGFQGEMEGDRKRYERKRMELYEKARLPGTLGDVLTPQAYGQNVGRPLMKMPNVAMSRVILVAGCALVFFIVAGYLITGVRSSETTRQVEKLVGRIETTTGAAR